jgi:hypothetical protein
MVRPENKSKCRDLAATLLWRPEFAVEPANRSGLQRIRTRLSFMDKAALYASQGPMFEAESPRRNVLDLHAGLALRTSGPHGMARR